MGGGGGMNFFEIQILCHIWVCIPLLSDICDVIAKHLLRSCFCNCLVAYLVCVLSVLISLRTQSAPWSFLSSFNH